MRDGAARLGVRDVRSGLCGGKAGRRPLPWEPYRRSMNPGSRGVVEVGWRFAGAFEAGTQLVKSMLSARVEPVGQSWACGAGGGGAEAGAGDEEVGTTDMRLSTSLCGWYRSGM